MRAEFHLPSEQPKATQRISRHYLTRVLKGYGRVGGGDSHCCPQGTQLTSLLKPGGRGSSLPLPPSCLPFPTPGWQMCVWGGAELWGQQDREGELMGGDCAESAGEEKSPGGGIFAAWGVACKAGAVGVPLKDSPPPATGCGGLQSRQAGEKTPSWEGQPGDLCSAPSQEKSPLSSCLSLFSTAFCPLPAPPTPGGPFHIPGGLGSEAPSPLYAAGWSLWKSRHAFRGGCLEVNTIICLKCGFHL